MPETTPLIEELPDDELPDEDLPDDVDEELPDADEESPLLAAEEPSKRQPRYSRTVSRQNPAPIPEVLADLHRKVTAPAPVPSGRVRD